MFGEGHFRPRGHHRGLGLGDHRALPVEGGAGVLQLRLGHQGFGVRRLGRGTQVAIVDQRQQLAGLDPLVVFHQHFLDETRHARGHQGVVGTHEGIVGGLFGSLAGDQVHQHAQDRDRRHADGDFVFDVDRHKNLLSQ